MKKYTIYIASIALLVLTFFFFSCAEEETVSVQERIEAFLSDLNSDTERDDIWSNLHDSIDNPWKLPVTWEDTPFAIADIPFTLGSPTYGSSSADATLGSSGIYNGGAIHFALQEDESAVWYITVITVAGTQWIPTP